MRVVSLSPPCVQSASIHFFFRAATVRKRFRNPQGAVAQLGERLICIQEVAGSIPTSSTNLTPISALSRNSATERFHRKGL